MNELNDTLYHLLIHGENNHPLPCMNSMERLFSGTLTISLPVSSRGLLALDSLGFSFLLGNGLLEVFMIHRPGECTYMFCYGLHKDHSTFRENLAVRLSLINIKQTNILRDA